ncbi:MAG: hypothetical protein PVG20_04500 [Thioalkalispiraceae bacterium]|jgi:hypothetical protein
MTALFAKTMPQIAILMLKPALQSIVEELCNHGCRQVTVYINQIETGKIPKPMTNLSAKDKEKVLQELKSIMAVYDRCC